MAIASRLVTAEDLFRLPSHDGKTELVRGEVIEMAPPGGEHGGLQLSLAGRMYVHSQANGLKFVVTETGFRLRSHPDTVRAPDIAFVEARRLPSGKLPAGYIDGPPTLAVEIVSPGDTHQDVQEKIAEYLEAGARRVWAVNPRQQSVTVHHPDGSSRTLRHEDTLSGEDSFPGFAVKVRDLFS